MPTPAISEECFSNTRQQAGSRGALRNANAAVRHGYLFVGGLHRSGTTLLARSVGEHPLASCLSHTGVPEDEGQHLQSVYPTAASLGGPGRFGFSSQAHLTEESPLVDQRARRRLLRAWRPYWDLSRPLLIEKSPPNVVRTRFLQALFPHASFLIIVRHPVAVSAATQKWSRTSPESLLEHWAICHGQFLDDLTSLQRVRIVRYEDFVAKPAKILRAIFGFLGLPAARIPVAIEGALNERYFDLWRSHDLDRRVSRQVEDVAHAFGYRVGLPQASEPASPAVARLLL